MKIIIGLGNPGEKYKLTRHNAGFMALDAMADELGLKWKLNEKIKAEIIKSGDIILAKPITYINNSGDTVQKVLNYYYKSPLDKGLRHERSAERGLGDLLTVIHDDLDMIIGNYKTKTGSSAAGHNGVQSIIDRLGTKRFQRIKIGVEMKEGRSARKIPGEKFVLQKFKKEEMGIIKKLMPEIIEKIKKERP